MKDAELQPAVVHESLLIRAIQTTQLALGEMGRSWIPVKRSWRLNERHYGALQGLNKAETAAKHGDEQIKIWRRSYDIAPPGGESLKDTAARTLPPSATFCATKPPMEWPMTTASRSVRRQSWTSST